MPLPRLPGHKIRVVDEVAPPEGERGFIFVRRLGAVAAFANGETSERLSYDAADRTRLDAIVVAPHFVDAQGVRRVVLRSALRPPVALRPREVWPVPEKATLGELWELPAGLVEEDERSPDGLRAAAARELYEETGYDIAPDRLGALGPSTFPAPGVIGERHFYFHAEVDPKKRAAPTEDGSVLERHAIVVDVPLKDAMDACRSGEIEDAKTELALRRLEELFGGRS